MKRSIAALAAAGATVLGCTAVLAIPQASAAAQGCRVDYTVTNQWQGGFQASVKVGNTGTAAVTGWTVTWTYADGQRVTQAWNAQVTQSGAAVTALDAGWNKTIPAGGSAEFGFTGSSGTANGKPAAISLNGKACTTS